MFEKRAMFEPIVPVPTLRIFEAKILGVERAFDAKTLPITCRFADGAAVPNPARLGPVVMQIFEDSMRSVTFAIATPAVGADN
jgi:hypothetical protein